LRAGLPNVPRGTNDTAAPTQQVFHVEHLQKTEKKKTPQIVDFVGF
jgi:hypothetical protein